MALRKIVEAPTPFDHQFVQGQPIADYYPEGGGRWYRTPLGDFPSVTTVLSSRSKAGIDAWVERVGQEAANKKKNQAAHKGNGLHTLAEKYILDGQVDIFRESPTVVKLFKQVQPELDKNVGKVYGVELGLYSDFLCTAGRSDLIADWKGVPSIIDYKNSIKEKPEKYLQNYFWQSTCYAIMMRELHDVICEQFVLIIGLNSGEECQIVSKPVSKYETAVKDFYRNAAENR